MQSREGLQLELIAEEGMLSSLQARLAVQREKLAQLKEQFKDVNENNLAAGQDGAQARGA